MSLPTTGPGSPSSTSTKEHLFDGNKKLPTTSLPVSATSIQRQDGLQQDMSMNREYETETKLTGSYSSTDSEGEFLPNKKKRAQKNSDSNARTTIHSGKAIGRTIIFVPQGPETKIEGVDPIKLTTALEANCAYEIINLRPNARLNILAEDTRNFKTTAPSHHHTVWCSVRSHEPRMSSMAAGVIHGMPVKINENAISEYVKSEFSVVRVRRL